MGIYGYYPVIEGSKTTFYRHPIRQFSFTELDGRSIFKRICSVIDELPPDLEFEVSQQSELQFTGESGLSQELEGHHLSQESNADSTSLLEEDESQSSLVGAQGMTPNTSIRQRTEGGAFKMPKEKTYYGMTAQMNPEARRSSGQGELHQLFLLVKNNYGYSFQRDHWPKMLEERVHSDLLGHSDNENAKAEITIFDTGKSAFKTTTW